MVATRLFEVTNKGKEWAYGKSSSNAHPDPTLFQEAPPSSSSSAPSTGPLYWMHYASDSLDSVAQSAYSTLASLLSSLYTDQSAVFPSISRAFQTTHSSFPAASAVSTTTTQPQQLSAAAASSSSLSHNKRSLGVPAMHRMLSSRNLAMILENPYNTVRGRKTDTTSSVDAVRSLLTIVPFKDESDDGDDDDDDDHNNDDGDTDTDRTTTWMDRRFFPPTHGAAHHDFLSPPPPHYDELDASWRGDRQQLPRTSSSPFKPSAAETASQIAEGTVRALRDLCLDEAVELHLALRFWTERWERPVLSWLEAGPQVWTSPGGYNHRHIGQKVAQIQAVLARRCAVIGELQQHLLRAGWQRGVAQWGVLGHGGQWAAVAGFDGSMNDESPSRGTRTMTPVASADIFTENAMVGRSTPKENREIVYNTPADPKIGLQDKEPTTDASGKATANIFVRRRHGGGLFVDDPAFLAEWSVEAIALVRRLLTRAANGMVTIPYESNWRNELQEEKNEDGQVILDAEAGGRLLPLWATEKKMFSPESSDGAKYQEERSELIISDLPLMCEEVSELLTAIEEIMETQRQRRLDKLRQPGWLRRNWYVMAMSGPPVLYILYKMLRRDYLKELIRLVKGKISEFYKERLREPIVAIVKEIWTGREDFSDKQARMEAIESLKKMIRSWLDDTYPNMPEAKRIALSEAMDVTLLEQKKEESMKTFFEINNVIRMSFIEMQYMKKELLNALFAIDQMMSANDINMNLAATTPVVLLAYLSMRTFRFLYYALLKLGKSREEIYASFRNILTDIERLLVMRDNPPHSPGPAPSLQLQSGGDMPISPEWNRPRVLGPDDLGMLMLLIHECRSILWRDRRRFTTEMIRGVSEDLAELAGERGAVSVQQQLQIITRMCRTYPFLKVTSIGYFRHSRLRAE